MGALRWLKNSLLGTGGKSYLFRGGLWIAGEQAITTATGALFGVVLIRTLTQADYGTYRFFFSLFAVLQIFLWSGMNAAVMQATGKGDDNAFHAVVQFRLRWAPLFACAASGLALYYGLHEEYGLAAAFLIVAVLHPASTALATYQPYLQGTKKLGLSALASSITQIGTTAAMTITLVLTESLTATVAAYATTNLAMNALFFTIFRTRKTDFRKTDVLRYGKHLTVVDSIGTITQQLDQLLLFYIWGPAVLAEYAVVQLFPGIIYNFLKSTTTLTIPLLAPKKINEVSDHFYAWLAGMFIVSAIVSGAYAAAAPTLFRLFFPNYSFLVGYTQLVAINLAWALPAGFIGSVFTAQKLLRASYGVPIATNAIRIVLYVSLGFTYGLQGMIAACLASRIIGIVINILLWEYERRRANS